MFTIETIFVIVCIVALLAWLGIGALFSIAGQWERYENIINDTGSTKETVTLGQFGPFIVGRREVSDGYQTYSGFIFGRHIRLKRRDFGLPHLMEQGFPEGVAKKLEGEVMGHLRLTLSSDRLFLEGEFVPYKIVFSHTPPKVTSILPQKPVKRRYKRVLFIKDAARALVHDPR